MHAEAVAQAVRAQNVTEQEASETRAILPLILKADVSGTAEALAHTLAPIGNARAGVKIVSQGVVT